MFTTTFLFLQKWDIGGFQKKMLWKIHYSQVFDENRTLCATYK